MRKMMLTGYVVADVQKQVSSTGTEYFNIRIANNEIGDEKDDNGNPITYWFRATCFNPQLFRLIPYLKKGSYVLIIGKYTDSLYQNKTGNCDINRDIIIDSIEFVGGGGTKNNETKSDNKQSSNATSASEMPKVTNKGTTAKKQEPLKATKEVLSDDSDDDDDLPF